MGSVPDNTRYKKTMLEPLQNGESRRKFHKELIKNYKKDLDEQCASKITKPKDIVEGHDIKILEGFVKNESLNTPILFPGTNVGDEKIDKALFKFLDKERAQLNQGIDDLYDDDVFKRRNLEHIHRKEAIKHQERNSNSKV